MNPSGLGSLGIGTPARDWDTPKGCSQGGGTPHPGPEAAGRERGAPGVPSDAVCAPQHRCSSLADVVQFFVQRSKGSLQPLDPEYSSQLGGHGGLGARGLGAGIGGWGAAVRGWGGREGWGAELLGCLTLGGLREGSVTPPLSAEFVPTGEPPPPAAAATRPAPRRGRAPPSLEAVPEEEQIYMNDPGEAAGAAPPRAPPRPPRARCHPPSEGDTMEGGTGSASTGTLGAVTGSGGNRGVLGGQWGGFSARPSQPPPPPWHREEPGAAQEGRDTAEGRERSSGSCSCTGITSRIDGDTLGGPR